MANVEMTELSEKELLMVDGGFDMGEFKTGLIQVATGGVMATSGIVEKNPQKGIAKAVGGSAIIATGFHTMGSSLFH